MSFINTLILLLSYLGIRPGETTREILLFPIWKVFLYLNKHPIHIIFVVVFTVSLLILRKKRGVLRKQRSKQKITVHTCLAIIFLFYAIFLAYRIYRFDPAHAINLKEDTFNILVFPMFSIKDDFFLSFDNTSIYFQDVLFESLQKNNPKLPEFIPYNLVKFPYENIPTFLYKPTNFNNYLQTIPNYTICIWGFKADNQFEKVSLTINPLRSAAVTDEELAKEYQNQEQMSNTISLLFNELKELPLKTKIEYLSLFSIAVVEQSANQMLVEERQYERARMQINQTIQRIDTAFQTLLSLLPRDRQSVTRHHYNKYRQYFLEVKRNIEAIDIYIQYPKLYRNIIVNPYLPFKGAKEYFSWLSRQDGVYSFSRLNPILNWPRYDSEFEKFIGCLLETSRQELPEKKVVELFDALRKKHGDLFVVDYYETIFWICRKTNPKRIDDLLAKQKQLNSFDIRLTDRQIEFYSSLKEGGFFKNK